jgi:hypothetical protein
MTEDQRSRDERDAEADKGFKIDDRRRFSDSGDERPDTDDTVEAPAEAQDEPLDVAPEQSDPKLDDAHQAGHADAEITFSSFAFGLASQAIMFLGLAPDPASGVVHKDIVQAQALIDILAMLEGKTRGNLDEDEARMMEEMLYELRMLFVRETRGHADPQETT